MEPQHRHDEDGVRRRGRIGARDLVAGLTVAAMLVPQAMAYALLAGLPPQVGLYAAIVPVAVYAALGTSRHLAVGPVAIVSLLTATVVQRVAGDAGLSVVAVAGALALVVGVVHVALGAARLGVATRLLSHPVLVGLTAGAGILIAMSQVRHLLGVQADGADRVQDAVVALVREGSATHGPTVVVGVLSLGALVVLRRWVPRFPGALVVVVAATIASAALGLADAGVATVGTIPQGLPPVVLPGADELALVPRLLPSALVITLVGFVEAIAVAKVYASRHGDEVDPDRELVALGGANIAAGVFGGFPVSGGLSRTAVQAEAGARTRLTGLVAAAGVAVVVVAFTPLLRALPTATLGALVLAATAGLVDVGEILHVARLRRSDFATLVVAFVATLVLGVEIGMVLAVAASLVIVVWRIMAPHTAILGRLPGTDVYRNVDRFPEAEVVPGLEIIRFDVSLNYMNVEFLKRRVRRLVAEADPAPNTVLLDAAGVNDVDVSALEALVELVDELDASGITTHLADVKGPVRDVLARSGLRDRFDGRMHREVPEAVAAIRAGAGAVGRVGS